MAQQLAMIIDSSKCIDCKGCVMACKVANGVSDGHSRNWIKQADVKPRPGMAGGGHFQPGACMHCATPTCVTACPTGATYKDEQTGEVVVDKELCIGCGNCIAACPYDARFRDPVTRKVDKCNYCAERRAAGLQPACVDTCPTKARVFGDINDLETDAGKLFTEKFDKMVQVTNAKTDTQPNMFYYGGTAPANWTRAAVIPASMQFMKDVNPLIQAVVGLSGLGVLAMLGRQLLAGSDEHSEDKEGRDA